MQKNRYFKKIIVIFAMSLMFTGLVSTKAEAKTGGIKVTAPSGKTVKVAKGKKVKLKTKVTKLKGKKVSYKVANPLIARVAANGVVRGVKAGKTKITVTSRKNEKIKKTIKVIVYKKAVKKIKLSDTKKTLNVNQQFNLKANVLPKKKASKALKFSSSNKKVATVTKKGLVKAVGVGTANITVKATDGSKKKSVCVVNVSSVNEKTGIKNVKIRSYKSLEVELIKPKKLEPEDFKAYFKYISTKKYVNDMEISEVHTQDNIHYELVLEDRLKYATYVNVVINSLDGVKSKEIVIDKSLPYEYNENGYGHNSLIDGNVINTYVVGKVGHWVYFNAFETSPCVEYAYPMKMSVSNLPEGVRAEYSKNDTELLIDGYCNKKLNGHKAVVTGIDAKGKKLIQNFYFYIGDDNTVYTKACDVTRVAYSPNASESLCGDTNYTPYVYCTDIKNHKYDYTYSKWTDFDAVGLPENVMITENGDIIVEDESKEVKPGTYNILITCNTDLGNDIIIRYKLTLVEGVVISGKVTDAFGNPDMRFYVYFNSNNNADGVRYSNCIRGDENGNYKIRILPGHYNIIADSFYESYQNDFTKSRTYNIVSNYCRVELTNALLDKLDGTQNYIFGMHEEDEEQNNYKFTMVITEYKYDENTSKYSSRIFVYLKKGHTYYMSSYINDSYTIIVDKVKYIVKPKLFKYTGQKSIAIEFGEV